MISVLVVAGVLATYVSGSFQITNEVTPGGTFIWGYGFPFPWITMAGTYCGSPLGSVGAYTANLGFYSLPCLKSLTTSYDWILFAGDVLFYFAASYGLILLVRKTWNDALKFAKRQVEQLQKSEAQA